MKRTTDPVDQLLLTLMLVNAVLLAMIELFFLPMRFDGRLLPELSFLPAPLSLLLAAVTTPWLVSQTARLAARIGAPGGFAGVPLGLWVLTVVVLGLTGPGGDLVLLQDWRGIGLLAAGMIPGALALGMRLGRATV